MSELSKLKTRVSNMSPQSKELRITSIEARKLVEEIDELTANNKRLLDEIRTLRSTRVERSSQPTQNTTTIAAYDGGTF